MASEREFMYSIFGDSSPDINDNGMNTSSHNTPTAEEYMHDGNEDQGNEEPHAFDGDEQPLHAFDGDEQPLHAFDGDEEPQQSDGNDEPQHFDDEDPQVGMTYETLKEVKDAYKAFAKRKGFDVAIRNSRYNYIIIGCARGRTNDKAKKKTKRVACEAKINAILLDSGRWSVKILDLAHNHELDPDMSPFMAGHRSISFGQKRQLEEVDMAGVPVAQNIRMLQTQAGGPGHVGCSSRDCRNFIDIRRRLRLGNGDASAIHNLFLRLQQKDPRFFHLMDIDDDGRLRNVMWIHPRSRAAYEDFHDVITFDTTYLVNRYRMPFATVVGVNQHHQSILLGCALLTHEQSESFKWFFSNWVQAMGGVMPRAILTDQCESIKNALKEVMPETIHRYCIWHILYKLPDKFKGIKDYNKTATAFKNIIYDSLSIAEFESRWGEFLIEYRMSTNKWLEDLYAVRDRWVPRYLNHSFWAGMLSTQMSESMHAFFDSYINSRSTLKSFVEQYEIAITNKTHKELEADYQSKFTHMVRRTHYQWEDHFGHVYTNNVFALLQKEIAKVMNCNLKQLTGNIGDVLNGIERYEILEKGIIDNWYHKEYVYLVEYRSNGGYMKCECRKFESTGILCCHILKFLVFKDIRFVNDRYVLRRWRKDVYRPHSKILFSGGYAHLTKEYILYQEFEKKFEKCNEIAFNNPARMDYLRKRLDELPKELADIGCALDEQASCNNETEIQRDEQIIILDPKVTNSKGRPKKNRLKSTCERNRERAANKRSSSSRGRGGRGRGAGNNTIIGTQGSVAN